MADRYIIVGLGNPGPQYANTRHNIGFRCVNALAEAYALTFDKKQSKAKIASGTIAEQPIILSKPQTFMNLSGGSVSALANFYKIPTERIMVIFDDLDLPLGTLRIRQAGGSGGHKGMKSIIQHMGRQDFPRIRFGINRPPGRMDPAAYVLRPFDEDEEILVAETVDRVVKVVVSWLSAGIDKAMNEHNGTAEQAAQRRAESQPEPLPNSISSENEIIP